MIYPSHVRWLAVWKRVFGRKTWRTIGRHLSEASIGQKGPTKSTMKRWVKRYKLYGDVADDARKKGGNLLFTRRRDLTLLKILADSPGDMLVEIRRKFIRRTGVRPALSTVCQAVHRLGWSRKQLRAYFRKRSARKSHIFWSKIVRRYSKKQLFFWDETAKDERAMRRSFGYAALGKAPIAVGKLYNRGARYSSCVAMDKNGIVAWKQTTGTFNRERFLDAARRLVRHVRPFPGRRSVVIMDNASIHKSRRLRRMIELRGGRLLFTPPYAFDRTPLDNGAFGLVVRFLKKHSRLIERTGLCAGLNEAFRSIRRKQAKYCFRNCDYHFMR